MKTTLLFIVFLLSTLFAQAQSGSCLNFDGINDKVATSGINTVLSTKNRITVEAWIKPTAFTTYGVVIGNYNTGLTDMQFMLRQEGSVIGFWVNVGSGFQVVGSGSGALTLNTWQHVAGVWDGSKLKLYVNGVLKGTTTGVTGTSFVSLNNPILMGGHSNGELFKGSIDEVRIWTRDLCLGEILNNKNGEIATSATGLLANYHFNQGVGGSVNTSVNSLSDASGNNYNGSLSGFALSGAASNWLTPGGVVNGSTVSSYNAVAAVSTQTNVPCSGGNTGTASVTASGGTSPYTYSWSPTGGTASTATNLSASTYVCAISDVYGCSLNKSVTILQTPLTATFSVIPIACNGGTAEITVGATGGTLPYTGVGTFNQPAGTYSYTLSDVNGCTTTSAITITQPAVLTATSSATPIICNGETATVTVSASGGTLPYTGNGTFSELAGTYAYTVTDTKGCTATTTDLTITQPTVLTASSSATTLSCHGDTSTVTVTAAGGIAPYTGTGLFNELAGMYSYTVTDSIGCDVTSNITITEPTALIVTATNTSILCNGGSSTVTVTASGGTAPYLGTGTFTVTAGTHTYTVTDNNGCSSSTTITITEPTALIASSTSTAISCNGGTSTVTVTASGGTALYLGTGTFTVLAGTHTYTVTDNNGCTSSTTITVTEPTALIASSSATAISCNGGTSTVTVTASGGTAPYLGTGTFTVTAGTHTYTVTDSNGCTSSTTITITEPTALIASSTSTAISCNGGSAAVTISATGGTAPYLGTGTFTVTAGTHTYTVTDNNGCTSSTTITITEPTALIASSSATSISCNGGTSTVTVTASGGTAPYLGTGTFTLLAGTHTYTVTDNNGCSASTTITVTEPTALIASSSATAISCNGGTSTVTVTASGGTAPYLGTGTFTVTAGTHTYTVTDNNGCTSSTTITITEPTALIASSSATAISCNGGTSAVTISATGGTAPYAGTGTFTVLAGTHTYTVTDNNGCTSSTTITITEPTALMASSSATIISCNGGMAAVTISATGGTAPYTGTGTVNELAGTYSYTVSDANGCEASTTITISEPTALTASSSATTISCNGGMASITISATGGTAPYTGTGTVNELAGTYSYTVSDANGCEASTTITITEPTALMASSSATTISCNGGMAAVTISATGGTAPYAGTGPVNELAGTYTYTVSDANGCEASTTITITEPTAITTTQAFTICLGDTIMVGMNGYSSTGTYQDLFTSVEGCDSTVITNLTVNDGIDVTVITSGVTLTSNQSGAEYQWIDCATNSAIAGETNQSFTAVSNGEYAVVVSIGSCMDTSACNSITTVGVNVLTRSAISVYPNPNNGLFTVELTADAQIEIIDLLGKVLLTQYLGKGKHSIDLSNEYNGIYVLSMSYNGLIEKVRVVKN